MAIKISDNLDYKGTKPDFQRQSYATKEALKNVVQGAMPELYLAFCLEDRQLYLYDKSNDDDPTTGKFRIFQAGSTTQVTEMPEADEPYVDVVLQYVGETDGNYTKGWFYECDKTETTEEKPVETIEKLTELIEESDGIITLKITEEESSEVQALLKDEKAYFVYEESVYTGDVLTDNVVELSTSTVIDTDEAVAELGLTYTEVISTTYAWDNISVSPSSGEPAVITQSEINDLFN